MFQNLSSLAYLLTPLSTVPTFEIETRVQHSPSLLWLLLVRICLCLLQRKHAASNSDRDLAVRDTARWLCRRRAPFSQFFRALRRSHIRFHRIRREEPAR